MRQIPRLPALMLATSLAQAGCGGGTTTIVGPPGDNLGEHLVAFVNDTGGSDDIGLYDLDQGGFRSVAGLNSTFSESEPCLSEDGNFLVFQSNRTPATGGGSDLYLYDRLQQALIATPGLNSGRDERWPRFTRDASRLVFVQDSLGGSSRVRMYEPVGDTLVRLPGLNGIPGVLDDEPSPDLTGARIAFTSDRSGRREVWVWNRAAAEATQPAGLAGDGTDREPMLSRDGRWLAFASNRSGGAGGFDIYLYDLTAGAMVALPGINSAEDDLHPGVSNDGQVLVLASVRAGGAGGSDLYRYNRTGATLSAPPNLNTAANQGRPWLRWR